MLLIAKNGTFNLKVSSATIAIEKHSKLIINTLGLSHDHGRVMAIKEYRRLYHICMVYIVYYTLCSLNMKFMAKLVSDENNQTRFGPFGNSSPNWSTSKHEKHHLYNANCIERLSGRILSDGSSTRAINWRSPNGSS